MSVVEGVFYSLIILVGLVVVVVVVYVVLKELIFEFKEYVNCYFVCIFVVC